MRSLPAPRTHRPSADHGGRRSDRVTIAGRKSAPTRSLGAIGSPALAGRRRAARFSASGRASAHRSVDARRARGASSASHSRPQRTPPDAMGNAGSVGAGQAVVVAREPRAHSRRCDTGVAMMTRSQARCRPVRRRDSRQMIARRRTRVTTAMPRAATQPRSRRRTPARRCCAAVWLVGHDRNVGRACRRSARNRCRHRQNAISTPRRRRRRRRGPDHRRAASSCNRHAQQAGERAHGNACASACAMATSRRSRRRRGDATSKSIAVPSAKRYAPAVGVETPPRRRRSNARARLRRRHGGRSSRLRLRTSPR